MKPYHAIIFGVVLLIIVSAVTFTVASRQPSTVEPKPIQPYADTMAMPAHPTIDNTFEKQLRKGHDETIKLAFHLGACYAQIAKDDSRFQSCKTYGDVADLSWKLYQAAEKKRQRK